jgi:hypothetical protein
MAAAEVDGYRAGSYAKYSVEQRAAMREAFYGARSAVFWHLFLLKVPSFAKTGSGHTLHDRGELRTARVCVVCVVCGS